MTTNKPTPGEVDRLRSDIATIHSVMDDTLPFTRADIRFSWLIIAGSTLSLAMELLGWSGLSSLFRATANFILVLALLGHQWIKSRAASQTAPAVKREYRFAIIAVPILLVGLMGMWKWVTSLSVPSGTFFGIVASVGGLLLFILSFYNHPSSSKYRRIGLRYLGIMTALLGLVIPSTHLESTSTVLSIYGIVLFLPVTLWAQSLLKKQESLDVSTANAF